MTYILSLDDPLAQNPSMTGQKGSELARLLALGLPVPPGRVIRTAVCEETQIRCGQQTVPLITTSGSVLDDAYLETIGPDDVVFPAQFVQELDELLATYPPQHRFAVRSSTTHEDGALDSFAGQYDTYLNCSGKVEITRAVAGCLLSLWSPRAKAYRQFQNFSGLLSIAVILQDMVDCEAAGVAFGLNPVSGDLDSIVINARSGLGTGVVDGSDAVEQFTVRRSAAPTADAITSQSDAFPAWLSPENLTQISELVQSVERHRGFPQDVEWGILQGRCVLFQSRPITALPPRWTRDESAERFPTPITPFAWDIVAEGFHRSLAHSLQLMGFPPFKGEWFSSHHHYVYGNETAMEIYRRRLAWSLRHINEGLEGWKRAYEETAWVFAPIEHWSRKMDLYLTMMGAFDTRDLAAHGPSQLWQFIKEVRDAGFEYFAPNVAISMGHGMLSACLKAVLTQVMDQEADEIFVTLTSTCDTKTAAMNRELLEMAAELRAEQQAQADAAHTPEFHTRFDSYIKRHFHREVDHLLDGYYPTIGEMPEVVLESVRKMAESGQIMAQESLHDRQRKYHKVLLKVLSHCPPDRRASMMELIEVTRAYVTLDDTEHYETTRLQVPIRRAMRALGRILVAQGAIEEELDLYFARFNTLEAAIQSDDFASVSEQIRFNKADFMRAVARRPDWVLGQSPTETPQDDSIRGLPCSAGVVEGIVCFIESASNFNRFRSGAILLAHATTPSWTPLFYSAAGVITEAGGPLSHAALTAREIGIPAVMGVKGALSKIADGSLVRMDGRSGTIVKL